MKNEEYMKELEKRLTDFRSARQNMKELAVAIIGDVLYKEDLFFTSAIDRSMGLLDGMIEMLKQRNLTCAGILVRTQVDNCMRVFAAFIAEDRTEFIDAFLKGEKIRNIKDNQGRKMKDVVLKERLAEYDKYLKNVYDNSSGYIHLSSKAFHKSLQEHGSESGSSFTGNFYRTRKKGVVSDDHWNRPWVLCHENKTGVFPDRTDAVHL